MAHPFMASFADELAERGIATLRYQFPYMERGSKRPDTPKVAQAAVRGRRNGSFAPGARIWPLFAGGKSFGGRMTSQAQAASPLPGVRGLVFLGFPLHPPGKPGDERGAHLLDVQIPMLFLQGSRDEFARTAAARGATTRLGARATLAPLRRADHSFHVPARTGSKDPEVRAELADAMSEWMAGTA